MKPVSWRGTRPGYQTNKCIGSDPRLGRIASVLRKPSFLLAKSSLYAFNFLSFQCIQIHHGKPLGVLSFDGVLLKHRSSELRVCSVRMNRARNHFVQFKARVAFVPVLFVHDISSFVVRAPFFDQFVQMVEFRRLRQNVEHGARQPA